MTRDEARQAADKPDRARFESEVDEYARGLLEHLIQECDEWHRKHTRSQILGGVCVLVAFILGKVL